MQRRDFLRGLGQAAVLAPLLPAAAMVDLARKRPEPLPTMTNGSLLTADSWNAIVNRINELSERAS